MESASTPESTEVATSARATVAPQSQRGVGAGERPLDADALYRAHKGLVASTLLNLVGPHPDIEDLVQSVFVGVIRGKHQFRGECSEKTWLYRIAVRIGLQELRRRRRKSWLRFLGAEADADAWPSGGDLHAQIESRSALRQLDAALSGLKAKKRAAFVLVDVQGLSLAEAAEILEVPVNTVRSRLGAARRELLGES